ncbi:IS110 family transposase, partial [Actinomycetospora soli]|uniref:IS110 family transposase n=1 Tax=Actinomycetospora soli TaxID=2893887 RepID=UPI001E573788
MDAAGPTVAGLDWSWGEHAVCVLGADGTVLERFEAEHNAAGLRELVRRLARHRVGAIGIERGEGLVVETLLGAGLQIFVISPRQVRALRLRYGTAGNKDDRFDAFVLADVLRTDLGRLAPLEPEPPRAWVRLGVRPRRPAGLSRQCNGLPIQPAAGIRPTNEGVR